MKPTDFRDATFEKLRESLWLAGKRWEVYQAFLAHGPGTTRQVAMASGIDLLTFRPRTTELCEAGFVALADGQAKGAEGVYRARTREEFEEWRKGNRFAPSEQQELAGLETRD